MEEVLKELMGEEFKEGLTKEEVNQYFKDSFSKSGDYVPLSKYKDVESKAKTLKEKDNLIASLQKELETKGAEGLTEVEKVQKELEIKNDLLKKAQLEISKSKVEAVFSKSGLVEDDYKEIIDGLVSEDTDKSLKLAESMASTIAKKVELGVKDAVSKKLSEAGQVPQGASSNGEATKESFDKMNYAERVKLYNEKPEVYKTLSETK